jgi:hypothetical protein
MNRIGAFGVLLCVNVAATAELAGHRRADAQANPVRAAQAVKLRGKLVTAFRGFQGSFQDYDSTYAARPDGQIWFATQMSDPAGYANSKGYDKYHSDAYDGHPVKLKKGGYIIEYGIPGNLTQQQDGDIVRPQPGPPKAGKSPRNRAEKGTWGFFSRKDIQDEAPYIKYVYLPKVAILAKRPVKIKGAGTFRIDVISAKYYRLPYKRAFVNGKPVSRIPKGTPVVRITKYAQDLG